MGRKKKTISTWAGALGVAVVASLLVVGIPSLPEAATESELQSAVFRAKPAVVMVAVRIGATATVRCGNGATTVVSPGAIASSGAGPSFIPTAGS